jgi:exosome complex component RRP46
MRVDKRESTEIRSMGTGLGLLKRSDGSAKFQYGNSIVLCGVFGPTAVKSKDEIIDKAFISVNFTPLSGAGGYAFVIHYQAQKTDFTSEY